MLMVLCADVVLLPLAHTHAGPQPCGVTSLNSVCVMSNGRLLQCRPPKKSADPRKCGWEFRGCIRNPRRAISGI